MIVYNLFLGRKVIQRIIPHGKRGGGLQEECRHNDEGGLIDRLLKKGLLKSSKEESVGFGIDNHFPNLKRRRCCKVMTTMGALLPPKGANLFKLIIVCWKTYFCLVSSFFVCGCIFGDYISLKV
jgi:hypothetical protein